MRFLEKSVQQILVQAANNIIDAAKKNLDDGDLKKSLRYTTKDGSIKVIMEEYGIFKDRGVSGANHSDFDGKKKKVHKSLDGFKFNSKAIGGADSMRKWMKRRGIGGQDRATVNFLIRRSIAQHGIKPSLFLTKPYQKYTEQIIQEFNNLQGDITKDINGTDR